MMQKYMFSGSFHLNGHDNDNSEKIDYIGTNDNQLVPLVLVKDVRKKLQENHVINVKRLRGRIRLAHQSK